VTSLSYIYNGNCLVKAEKIDAESLKKVAIIKFCDNTDSDNYKWVASSVKDAVLKSLLNILFLRKSMPI